MKFKKLSELTEKEMTLSLIGLILICVLLAFYGGYYIGYEIGSEVLVPQLEELKSKCFQLNFIN